MKRVIGLCRKILIVITTNLTSVCCVHQEKLVKHDSFRRMLQHPYKFTNLQFSTHIVNNSIQFQTNLSDIKAFNHQILFDAFVYSSYFSIFICFKYNELKTTIFCLLQVNHETQRHLAAKSPSYKLKHIINCNIYKTKQKLL